MSLEELWSQMSGVRLYQYGAPAQIPIIDGQSLATGFNGSPSQRSDLSYRCRHGVKMLTGLQRSDGVAVNLHGTGTLGYNSTPATGVVPASPAANAPACFTFAIGLDAWRRHFNRTMYPQIVGFNGISGQSIEEFDDDSPSPSGTLGTLIRDNHAWWLQQSRLVSPGAVPLVYGMIQGEADVGMTRSAYYAAATDSYTDALDDIQAATGIRPPLMLWQTGGYVDSTGDAYGSTLAQLDLVQDFGGVFAGPLYPALLHDNTVHPGLDAQLIWSEIGAYVWVRHEMGQNLSMLPGTPEVVGNQIAIPFSGLESGKSLTFDASGKYDSYGGLNNHGCEVSGANVTDVSLAGNAVTITADAAMSGRTVSIAMQSADMSSFVDGNGANYGAHRCDIMESAPEASLLVPGEYLNRYIPSCRWSA